MDYYSGAGDYDPETVRFFDVAHEGAQLRAVGSAAERLGHLRGVRPRSVVVVATDQVSLAAARAALTLRSPLPLPVVVCGELPAYVGPLDVVAFVGDAAGRESDVLGLARAADRGAETVLAGPLRGPLLDDAPSETAVIPALPTAAGPSPTRAAGVVGAVLAALEADPGAIGERCERLAAEVDDEVQALSPERDATANAARQLREFACGARVLHSGAGPVGVAVATVAAELWSARGIASGYVAPEELAFALELGRAGEEDAEDDLFRDPFLDGPSALVTLKTVLWAQEATAAAHTRAESVATAPTHAADAQDAAALRLIARAYAATAMRDRDASER